MFALPDAYTIRARIFPALLAALPGIALAAVMVSWRHVGLSHVVATGAVAVLLYAFADVARWRGKRLEDSLYLEIDGKPSTAMLRHRDTRLDAGTKDRWLDFLQTWLQEPAPTAAAEQADPAAADSFYERCGNWLRERTRDQKKFKLVFEENVTYGFRRNLLGLKWPGLILNVAVVVVCLGSLLLRLPISVDDDVPVRMLYVLIVALLHALFFLLGVNQGSVIEAANQYARSCC
jgi:hypothetical protein